MRKHVVHVTRSEDGKTVTLYIDGQFASEVDPNTTVEHWIPQGSWSVHAGVNPPE